MRTADKYIVAALCIGLFFGVAIGRFSTRWFHHEWFTSGKDFQHRLDRLSDKLGLSADQKAKVELILEARRDKMNALFAQVGPQLEDIRKATVDDVRALLTPEQQAKFDKLHAKREAEWKNSELYHLIHDHSPS